VGNFPPVAGLVSALVLAGLSGNAQRAFNIVLGAILGASGAVVTYWRGSSRGSAEMSVELSRW
jgi:hypothetical protein